MKPISTTDPDRATVRAILASARKRTRPPVYDPLTIFDAILTLLDHGAPWRDLTRLMPHLPHGAPHWRTVHEHFKHWTEGTAPTVLDRALTAAGRADLITRAHDRMTAP